MFDFVSNFFLIKLVSENEAGMVPKELFLAYMRVCSSVYSTKYRFFIENFQKN